MNQETIEAEAMIIPEMKLSYLAAPYTDKDKAVVEERMKKICIADSKLMKAGVYTVSPLMKHFILGYADLPGSFEYWRDYSMTLLCTVDQVIVLMLDGWKESEGVQAEIKVATDVGIPIVYLNEAGEFVEEVA